MYLFLRMERHRLPKRVALALGCAVVLGTTSHCERDRVATRCPCVWGKVVVMAAPSSERDAKRRRLRGLVGLKGVSTEALVSVLADVRDHGAVELSSWQANNFIRTEFGQVKTTVKVPMQEGEDFDWDVCRLDLLLAAFCRDSPRFREEFGEMVRAVGARRLDAVLYLDEVVPGNLLRPDNARKFWAFYLGFEQVGSALLHQEEFWLPVAILRANKAHSAVGGLSACVKLLVRSMLFGPAMLADIGIALDLGGPTLVRMRLKRLIGDEAALKTVWLAKGASGTRPCLFCGNVVAVSSGLADELPHAVDTSCSDPDLFLQVSDDDLWRAFDRLKEAKGRGTKRDFVLLQQASGHTCLAGVHRFFVSMLLGVKGYQRPKNKEILKQCLLSYTRSDIRPRLHPRGHCPQGPHAACEHDLHGLDAQLPGEWHPLCGNPCVPRAVQR